MPKLETYGVITPEELKQAEREGKFRIADNVTCSYCDQPVRVDTQTQYLYCPQHYKLALSLHWYPGYPAVPYDAPRYKEMHFFLAQLERNRPLFDRQTPEYIAREKGCPFCDRYLLPVDTSIETQRDASLLNQKMFCSECGVSFLIEAIAPAENVRQLRFLVDAKHLPKTDAPETDTDDAPQTENKAENLPRHLPENQPPNQNDSQPSDGRHFVDNVPPVRNASDVDAEIPEPQNAHTDIAGQILDYLSSAPNHTATTAEMTDAFNASPNGFNKAKEKLIEAGKIRRVTRGVYQLINPKSTT